MTSDPSQDRNWMDRALALAERGRMTTTPNPRVGCVVVNRGEAVGEGWHERAGHPHAEVHALQAAGTRAQGATAYVTLEPCSHFGRTPPCADALIGAGVARVVAAMEDPNPEVAGRGLERLRQAGLVVEVGLGRAEAEALNPGFISRMKRGRPWIRLKVAMSLDGRTALANGASQWITGPAARTDGHRWRAASCAILTAARTVLADDPALTVRHVETSRQPARLVIDAALITSPQAKIYGAGGKTWLFTAIDDETRLSPFRERGVEVVLFPLNSECHFDWMALARCWAGLGFNEILVESGARLAGSLARANLVDEYLFYVAPILLGSGARGVLEGPAIQSLAEGRTLQLGEWVPLGADWRILARPMPSPSD